MVASLVLQTSFTLQRAIKAGKHVEADFEVNKVEVEEPKPIENAENRIVLEDKAEEEKPKKKSKKADNDKD